MTVRATLPRWQAAAIAIFLAAPLAAQVMSIDSSGNLTAIGGYNSGAGTGLSGILSLKGSTSDVFGLTVGTTPPTSTPPSAAATLSAQM